VKRRSLGLRAWAPPDSVAVADWWNDCWTDACPEPSQVPAPAAEVSVAGCRADVQLITLDGVPSGLVATDDRVVCLIALRRGLRGWGYGSEAIVLVERSRTLPPQALTSPRVGLSLYFWLRLGYAPVISQPYAPAALLLEKLPHGG
jgi:hypothetical protein